MSRILLIDDRLSIRRMLQVLMQGAGHTMISADDDSHGLHALALEKPDLLMHPPAPIPPKNSTAWTWELTINWAVVRTDKLGSQRCATCWSRISITSPLVIKRFTSSGLLRTATDTDTMDEKRFYRVKISTP